MTMEMLSLVNSGVCARVRACVLLVICKDFKWKEDIADFRQKILLFRFRCSTFKNHI